MKRHLRAWATAHRLRMLLTYGWCPSCNSSPPLPECPVCRGSRQYGPRLHGLDRATWAARYIAARHP